MSNENIPQGFEEIPNYPNNYEAGRNNWFGSGILLLQNPLGYKWYSFDNGKIQGQKNTYSENPKKCFEDLLKTDNTFAIKVLNNLFPKYKGE